jgi:hypothetical protein
MQARVLNSQASSELEVKDPHRITKPATRASCDKPRAMFKSATIAHLVILVCVACVAGYFAFTTLGKRMSTPQKRFPSSLLRSDNNKGLYGNLH